MLFKCSHVYYALDRLSLFRIARIELGDEAGVVAAESHFFVDFMRDPPEATGDEDEDFDDSAPKVYEKIVDWNFLVGRVQHMQDLYNEHVKGNNLGVDLYIS